MSCACIAAIDKIDLGRQSSHFRQAVFDRKYGSIASVCFDTVLNSFYILNVNVTIAVATYMPSRIEQC